MLFASTGSKDKSDPAATLSEVLFFFIELDSPNTIINGSISKAAHDSTAKSVELQTYNEQFLSLVVHFSSQFLIIASCTEQN